MLLNNRKYYKPLLSLTIAITIILFVAIYSFSQTQPRLINFQGELTDQQGQPLDGTYTVVFSIYATATGGTALWTERHESLSISQGLVNALLGSIQSLDTPQRIDFDATRYLGITIDADNNANSQDPEMLPRQMIIPAIHSRTSDYATQAKVAETLLGGQNEYLVPKGGIIMWSGALANIPKGWTLCDGTKGAPDLRDRFLVGASSGANPGATGGTSSYTLSVNQLPSHAHTGSTSSDGNHSHSASISPNPHAHDVGTARCPTGTGNLTPLVTRDPWASYTEERITALTATSLSVSVASNGNHAHSFTTSSVGSGASIDNRPAYYALAFIMKL